MTKRRNEHHVVVIGAGGAGLCTSYYLAQQGIEHVVSWHPMPASGARPCPPQQEWDFRRITYDSTLHRSRSLLVGRRTPSKSVYPLHISPYNKPIRPSGRAEPEAGAAQRPAPRQASRRRAQRGRFTHTHTA